ncbi:hypothetical protein B0T25DRAFT_521793 [Lasiosphaeria hispida]|uniref:SnoaL-like domain-containing protein n=1 Tax=Lasiosphaeria hispida TaxID=260671 RepID=A0AAJ0H8D0_9PEZI|nr:hypothetical protein B0T25DRAFT_521793 [Lasiosphaeria hispida]
MAPPTKEVTDHLKSLYATYRKTADIDAKGLFYAPDIIQICGPLPSYWATDAPTIVRYVREALGGQSDGGDVNVKGEMDGCTIRPLTEDEFFFESDEVTAPTGFTAAQLKQRAEAEGWVGMRVDLWVDADKEGMLVKVKYWWKKQGEGWVQALHDITYMGPRDGTEGTDGEILP